MISGTYNFLAIAFPQIDPVIISLGPLAVHWYGMGYVVGILFGLWYAKKLVSNQSLWGAKPSPISALEIDDLLLWMALGIILGGRMGYVLFYDFARFFQSPSEIFAVWSGGMSFHGGMLGSLIAMVWFSRRRNLPVFSLFDVVTASAGVGIFLVRIANFINSELWGRVSDVSWAMVFPTGGPLPRHPSQLYEAMLEGAVLFVLAAWLIFGLKKLTRPGFIAGTWFAGYGISRIIVEFFREPDAHIGYLFGDWLTMGMLLSLPMVLIGIWAVATSSRRSSLLARGE